MESARLPGVTVAPRAASRARRSLATARRFRASTARALLTGGLALVSLVLAALPSFTDRAGSFEVTDGVNGAAIASLGIGTTAWVDGVRPGMPGEWQAYAGVAHHTFTVTLSVGRTIDLLASVPGEPLDRIAMGALLVLAGLALFALRLPASGIVFSIGTGVALLPMGSQLGLPAALPLIGLPIAVVIAAARVPDRHRQRRFDLVAASLLVGFLAAGALLARGDLDVNWGLFWAAPTVLAFTIAGSAELLAFATRWQTLPDSTPRRALMAALPVAAESRFDGADEERARLAIELHNVVLPQFETSVQSLGREGSVEAATDSLKAVAADLREVMQRHQTVTLEVGGVAEALRSEFAARDGARVEFFVRGGSHRPPRRIELAAYRVGQAAIDNALRHSGGDLVSVTINSSPDVFELSVADDGVGLDDMAEDEARRRGRIGLAQMRLRAEAVGATLDVHGRPGQGTQIRFHWAA